MKRTIRCIVFCAVAGLWSWPVAATTITSLTSGATWTGETVSNSEVDLNLPTSAPWTTAGFMFTSPNGNVSIMPNLGSTSAGLTTNAGEIDIMTPASGETAIFLNLGIWDGSSSLLRGDTVSVELSDGETFSSVLYGNFWFSSSTPITSVAVSAASGEEPFIHGIAYAESILPPDSSSPSPAPEASNVLLASSGLLMLAGARRWLRCA